MAHPLLPVCTTLASLLFAGSEADLVFVGDAMQHKAQLEAARSGGRYDYSPCFAGIDSIVSAADYAVVNLETPVGKGPYSGYPCFNAPTEFADALADAGFDMMLTANNHTLDHGPKGLRATIKHLDSIGIDHIGTYADDSARIKALPKVVNVKDFKIGFLNYTYGTNGIEPRQGVVVDYIDKEKIKNDIEATRLAGAELLAVCMHWGDEYRLLPNAMQKQLADFLESQGVDMIIGAHPHVIQPMEFRENKYFPGRELFLIYSLGNFVSNMKTADTRGGAMAHLKIYRDDDGKARLKEASYRLLFTIPGKYEVVEADSVKAPMWQGKAKNFADRARNIFDKHNISVPESK